jgi:predicted TIM-barrel fold metal-dependent hydrolase
MRMKRRSAHVLSVPVVLLAGAVVLAQTRTPDGPVADSPAGTGLPDIREYKPRSTLVVPAHEVPRAKFPVVDIHGHPPALTSPAVVKDVVAALDRINVGVMVHASGASGTPLRQALEAIGASGLRHRMVMFANVSFREVGPGFGRRAAAQLEEDVKAGALGLGEIMKGLGLTARKTDGSRLRVDDPELDPVWETAGRLGIPVFIHTADPAEFFEPFDYRNERWLEMSLFPGRRYFDRSRFPSFEELMAERDRVLMKHKGTRFVLAHLGWHAQDLGRLGAMFDRMPNVYGEIGAILYELGRQPRMARDFFIKHQDRLIFGKDSFQPDEYPYYWRTLETADEYFDYYRDYHAFWKLYGLDLPDEVLRKLYYANAVRLIPRLPTAALPG